MAAIALLTSNLLILGLSFLFSSLPLYLAVKFVGGEVSMLKVLLLSIVLSAVSLAALAFLGVYAGLFTLLATSVVYRFAFKLTTGKAILVWILQYVIALLVAYLAIYIVAV